MKLRLPGHRFRRFALITGFVLVAASGWIFRPGVIRALRGDHSLEDAPTDDWSAFRGEQAWRGEPGSSVRIRLRHPGDPEVAGVVLRRTRLRAMGPGLRILGPTVGYIRLGSLSRGSARTVEAAVTRMTGEGAG